MLNFNKDLWHDNSSCLTFLTQTALIIWGATLEIIQKAQLHKKAVLKLCCVSKYCVCVKLKKLKVQENVCHVCNFL